MDRQLAFERQVNVEGFAVSHSSRPARDRRQLPEERLISPPQRPQRLAPDLRVLFEHDLHSARLEYLDRAPLDVIVIGALGGGQQKVRDCEVGVVDSRADQPSRFQMLQPDFARDVGLNARAVAFAGDLARPVPHLGQRFDRPLDIAVRRPAVAFDAGDDRAGVAFFFDSQLFE